MIQAINTRRTSTAASAHRTSSSSSSETNEQHWGSWHGNKHYSLEVLQNPIRARMCGFGDKDRRPLAPAAVAKMIVKQEDDSIVDVDDIDVAFFVVTVDLWSQDAKHEMNLVLHPSSADRYIPTHVTKPKRRGTAPSAPPFGPTSSQRPDSQASQPSLQALPPPGSAYTSHTHPHIQSPYGNFPAQPPPPHTPGMPDPTLAAYPPPHPMYAPHPEHTAWGYPPYSHPPPPPPGHYHHSGYPTHPLPSIHSFHRTGTPSNVPGTPGTPAAPQAQSQWTGDHSQQDSATSSVPPAQGAPEISTFRGWPAPESSTAVYSGPSTAPSSAPAPPPYEGYGPPPPPVDGGPLYATQPYGPPPGHHAYAPLPPAPTTHSSPPPPPPPSSHNTSHNTNSNQNQNQNQSQTAPPSPAPSTMPLPRHTYTRTLVGPLSANACRLNDEHRKPGIFFLFQDLSIRTEGTFRLRLRLMNVGAHPAPEPGSTRVMTGISKILAQTFTEPFVVYSAKRFPGVPDTTALSIAFGNQGQKLPLRNRHGSRQGDRRRRRGDSVGSGDESDNS